jgi:hypothetical protein
MVGGLPPQKFFVRHKILDSDTFLGFNPESKFCHENDVFLSFPGEKKSESLYKSFLYITDNCHIDCYHLSQDYLEQDIKHIYLPM